MSLLQLPWKYISEGNVHILLEAVGSNHAIRLIKEEYEVLPLKKIQSAMDFINMVMNPLLSTGNTGQEELLEISEEQRRYIIKEIQDIRPEYRKYKSNLSRFAIKTNNLTKLKSGSGLNFCIEIKPKEGFMPESLLDSNKCYYCMKQYLKLIKNEIIQISEYCPLELFSGDKKLIKNSLLCLAKNPQNNFRIFHNGNIINNANSAIEHLNLIIKEIPAFDGSLDTFFEFLTAVLLSKVNENPIISNSKKDCIEYRNTRTSCKRTSALPPNSFLHQLLELQKLDKEKQMTDNCIRCDPDIQIVNLVKENNLNLALEEDKQALFKMLDPTQLTLLSAVAKDCSIMISFTPSYIDNCNYVQIDNLNVYYKISATDLGPKPTLSLINKPMKYKKVLQVYQGYLDTYYNCNIQPHSETRAKQLEAWQQLIAEYFKVNKLSTIDIREVQNSQLFNNTAINRKLSQEAVLTILEDMAKTGKAMPTDKSKMIWEVYWHSLDEWGNMVYSWVCNNGMNNSVCTLFELREGENTADEEFHGLDMNVLLKALKSLETKGKCELIEFEDHQGVKFF